MVIKERDCRFVRISNPENGAEKADDLQSVARTTDPAIRSVHWHIDTDEHRRRWWGEYSRQGWSCRQSCKLPYRVGKFLRGYGVMQPRHVPSRDEMQRTLVKTKSVEIFILVFLVILEFIFLFFSSSSRARGITSTYCSCSPRGHL